MNDTQRSNNVCTKQQRIAELARKQRQACFTSLNHYLDLEWLREAYHRLRADSAPGVDGQGVAEYGLHLEENLTRLLTAAKSGAYLAPPVRRVYIPKEGKELRPIGIPTTEDKVLQRAMAMILEPIYEQEFKYFSYGFRPGRSAHGALSALRSHILHGRTRWILDVDVRKYFDTLDHEQLRRILRQRVRDGVITRLIGKWLKAGVMEQGHRSYPETGSPQGGVISPLLSNIYLHEVLDKWWVEMVRPCLKGRAFLIRYADDFVMGFERKEDALKVYRVLFKRFEKYGLQIHPEKTRLISFGRPGEPGCEPPGTFDFLGFTHYWGQDRKGQPMLWRKTARKRFSRGLKRINEWCREHRHEKLLDQAAVLGAKLKGHFGYYGLTGNGRWLCRFRRQVIRIWKYWLGRRGGTHGRMNWSRMNHLLNWVYIPPARVVHSVYRSKTVA